MSPDPILVIGVGNPLRSDDALGVLVAEQVRKLGYPQVEVITSRGENIDLLSLWKGYSRVVVVDAMTVPPERAESVCVFFAHEKPLPAAFEKTSTHGMGPQDCIELARALGELPSYLAVLGVGGENFEIGENLTERASRAIPEAVHALKELLGGLCA